jgi:hypothetical protein
MYKQESRPKVGMSDNFFGILTTVKKMVKIQKMSEGILCPKSVQDLNCK